MRAGGTSTDGEVANALVCKTSIHGFKSHSVLHKIIHSEAHNKGAAGKSAGSSRIVCRCTAITDRRLTLIVLR